MLTEKKRNVRERELQKYKYVVREAVNFEEFERRCIKVFSFFTLLILEFCGRDELTKDQNSAHQVTPLVIFEKRKNVFFLLNIIK